MSSLQPHEQRVILALSFEPSGEGFLYYRHKWSRGIPVTAEEREAYLTIPVYGSRQGWRKALIGRDTFPPRATKPLRLKLLASLPHRVAIIVLSSGIGILISGLNQENGLEKVAYLVVGCTMSAFGISILSARHKNH